MKLWWIAGFVSVCAVIATDGAFAADDLTPMDTITATPGTNLPTRVPTMMDAVESCFLVTNKGESVQFLPEDLSSDKYELQAPIVLYGCQVTIKNLDDNDNGIWELYYTTGGEKKGSQYYDVTVTSQENANENHETETTIFTTIHYGARMGINITITLSKQEYSEDFYLHTPIGETFKLDEAQMSGVQVYTTSTNFVSCRVVIGPVEEHLLGTWTLCGIHTKGHITYERCQPGSILWATDDPESNWASTVQARFNHVVSYGFRLSPVVRGSGTINTCHVVTPAGEDIALTLASDYPGLARLTERDANACNVSIGPIDNHFIGDWVLYGTYRGSAGFNEMILPMNLFLYDEDDPYNQAYNVSSVTMQTHVISPNGVILLNVTGSGVRTGCELVTSSGERYNDNTIANFEGATFVNNNNAICRFEIGPMTLTMFGDWLLIGKFSRNNVFNEIQLPVHFIEEDPANPLPDHTDRTIQYLAPRHFVTRYGQSHAVSTASGSRIVTESCHIRNPNNLQYFLREGSVLPGVEGVVASSISCGVRVQVNDETNLGEWMLMARIIENGIPIERRLVFNITIEDPANPVPDDTERTIQNLAPQSFVTRYGQSYLVSTASGSRIVTDSCHIRTPDNLQYILWEGWARPGVEGVVASSISCGVRVHVNDNSALGEWMLIDRITDRGVPIERRIMFNISIEDSTDSSEEQEQEEPPVVLPTIPYRARIDMNITISLSKKDYTEDCYIQMPQGNVIKLEDVQADGIHTYPAKSNFVSCRVVIGPMDETLLGTWTLCGKHTEGQIVHERCQPGVISWATNNPADNWASTTHANFNHVVHYGFTLAPLVRGTGNLHTCHVITPDGEDITISEQTDYPGLNLVPYNRDSTVCSVAFGAIDEHFIGNWVIYGTYISTIIGFNVVTQPMTFFLYDEDNPYNQAYNVTTLNMESHILTEGLTVIITVTGSGTRNGCEFMTSSGDRYDQTSSANLQGVTFVNNNNAACRLQVGPLTKDMFGDWQLIGKFVRNNVLHNELQLPFRLIEEDPTNPIPDDIDRSIEYLNSQSIYTSFGNSHTFSNPTASRWVTASCHIRTPQHLQYILRSGLVLPGFQTATGNNIACGVQIRVNDVDALGEWMLITRGALNGAPIERRLPFTIYVEEEVNAVPDSVTVAEGNNLFMRLEKPTSLFDTCVLIGPTRNNADRDESFNDTCGFIVRDVTIADSGTWEIEYGTGKKYRALIRVEVSPRFELPEQSLMSWTQDAPVNETIGPEDTVFCKVEDPSGLIVFQSFGRCNIILDRVRTEHAGVWKMSIATSGRVRVENYEFIVKLSKAAPKALVATSVVTEKPSVTLSCKVEVKNEVTACKFRDPSGRVLLVNQGVGEDRYSFHANSSVLEENSHECGLRIINPLAEDLGLWRCVIETEENTYYGFLTVLCPWAMLDPAVAAAVVSEPTLTAEADSMKAIEGNNIIMRCSVQSAIRYCYYRSHNGTIFTVSPSTSDWFEYAGAGLDAGECSIRFPALQASDSGRWSCHVGFNDHSEPEQSAQILLQIDALMIADQYHLSDSMDTLVVHSQVHSQLSLEYCRFIRMDGIGFTSENIPSGYEDHSLLANGKCEIRITNPNILERHSWTVVAKIVGYNTELTRSTQHTLVVPEPDVESSTEHATESPFTEPDSLSTEPDYSWTYTEVPVTEPDYITPSEDNNHATRSLLVLWSCAITFAVTLFFVGLLLGPKRNREWTFQRAASLRTSLRKSMSKSTHPAPAEVHITVPTQTTPTAA